MTPIGFWINFHIFNRAQVISDLIGLPFIVVLTYGNDVF